MPNYWAPLSLIPFLSDSPLLLSPFLPQQIFKALLSCQAPCNAWHTVINNNKAGSHSHRACDPVEEADISQIIMKMITSDRLWLVCEEHVVVVVPRGECLSFHLGGNGFAMSVSKWRVAPTGLFAGTVFWEVLLWVHHAQHAKRNELITEESKDFYDFHGNCYAFY